MARDTRTLFKVTVPSPEGTKLESKILAQYQGLATALAEDIAASRELSLALTTLQESFFWASEGIRLQHDKALLEIHDTPVIAAVCEEVNNGTRTT